MSDRTEAIAARLADICEKNGGRLTPEAVVKDAMHKSSPLHGEFEWDRSKAAWSHWLDRARTIIRSIPVSYRDDKHSVTVAAYHHDPRLENEQGYIATVRIRNDQDLAREVLVREFSRAAALLTRARNLAVAFSLEAEVEDLEARLNSLRERIASDARAD